MGIAISQVFASLEPCLYARSVVRLTEKHSSTVVMKLTEK